jgi:hypothetical protein
MSAYCVVLRPRPLAKLMHPRIKRCYLSADAADRAMVIASNDNPEWSVIGIEPGGLTARFLQSERPASSTDAGHAA